MKVNDYQTATNILSATDSSGGTFLNKVATNTGVDYASTVVPIYEATKTATYNAVFGGVPTKEMKTFFQVGVANGHFTDNNEGIQVAINNYAAAITLSIIENTGSGSGAWTHLAANGVKSQPAS